MLLEFEYIHSTRYARLSAEIKWHDQALEHLLQGRETAWRPEPPSGIQPSARLGDADENSIEDRERKSIRLVILDEEKYGIHRKNARGQTVVIRCFARLMDDHVGFHWPNLINRAGTLNKPTQL